MSKDKLISSELRRAVRKINAIFDGKMGLASGSRLIEQFRAHVMYQNKWCDKAMFDKTVKQTPVFKKPPKI